MVWAVVTEFTEVVSVCPRAAREAIVSGVDITDPKELVALKAGKSKVGFEDIVNDPVAEVALKPVIPITSAGANAPTEDVADKPVSPITSAGANAPTDEVADKDESSVVFEELIDKEPTELVELNPVKPITSAGLKAPTDVLADNPVNVVISRSPIAGVQGVFTARVKEF